MSTAEPTSDAEWYWSKKGSGDQNGPVDGERLEELTEGGNLEPEDLVWTRGMDDWKEAGSTEVLDDLFASPPPLPEESSQESVEEDTPPSLPRSGKKRKSEATKSELRSTEEENISQKYVEEDIKVSKIINTDVNRNILKKEIERELRDVCEKINKTKKGFKFQKISVNTFGSINRKATGNLVITKKSDGYLVRAGIKYTTSWAFWIILIFSIYTILGVPIQIGFYYYHKEVVRRAIEQALEEVELLLK